MPGKPVGQRRGGLPRGVETLYQPGSSAADRSEEQSPRALSAYGADMLRDGPHKHWLKGRGTNYCKYYFSGKCPRSIPTILRRQSG
ncbi:hypothetical protein GCM10012278_80720 [Nonomuraea glycinis]|uniref:Uncharacterized protein n=1 Tax=Nonomuraea glycinis TaxID=2047744 RepID=A0A918EA61_9ACTN|nr:hypothetical protein GCM10012278_80720 [Nonomuraea glycinis]